MTGISPDSLVTLAELLAAGGWRTAAFVSAFVLDSRFGLDQGFETYDDDYSAEWSEENLRDAWIYTQMVTNRRADQTTDRVLAWLEDHGQEPFFLWVHYYDPHQRHDPPHPYNQLFQDSLYDGEIAFMDAQIGRLFAELRQRDLWRDTTVIVTADHGEGLGQHGETTHGVLTYDSTLRVAQIVKPPRRRPYRARGGGGARLPRRPDAHRLRAARGGAAGRPPRPEPGESDGGSGRLQQPEPGAGLLFRDQSAAPGLRLGAAVRHPQGGELYHLARDPGEVYNLAESEPERRRDLERSLFALVEGSGRGPASQIRTPAANDLHSISPEAAADGARAPGLRESDRRGFDRRPCGGFRDRR